MRYLKILTFVILACICFSFRYKKSQELLTGVAEYHFFHIRDTTNIGRIWTEDFLLAFNKNQSIYTSYTKYIQDSVQISKVQNATKLGNSSIDLGILRKTTADEIYINSYERNILVNKKFRQNNYLITEPLQKIDWKIGIETKTILGYSCQKATGIYSGRIYTAWFSTDIPASFGPWKLQGLPGLILEATDISGRISFACTKISFGTSLPSVINLTPPKDVISTNHEEYNRMEKAFNESLNLDPYGSEDMKIENVTLANSNDVGPKKKFEVNFPLELIK
ncbi:GLPGLI family protein [Pedobacter aquatilis]|uniref:GLPGLI family protein n=1 Tax=Pedobacter aquatilis TaxID=351343 RepID=UPI0025B3C77D|nr:GLPGLI family protein [Pedobacter aquatilis]MDN3588857.1 GLPGLI family protein [Pedobacter aquatilis]